MRISDWSSDVCSSDLDDLAALDSAFGAKVDDPVGGLADVEVMLDHHHGIALFHQRVEHLQQLADVFEVEAGGGFVEYVEGVSGGTAADLIRIGRAWCREGEVQYGLMSVVAVTLKKK